MDVIEAIWRELNDAKAEMLDVRRIRVTDDALRDSVTTVAYTPERARAFALRAVPGGGVVADIAHTERLRELLIHPLDFLDVRRDIQAHHRFPYQPAVRPGEPDRIFGVAVNH